MTTNRPGFELDADIESGDSGGPVVVDGKVVGVLWARSSKYDHRAYAIDPVAAGGLVREQLRIRRDRRLDRSRPLHLSDRTGVRLPRTGTSSSGFQKPGSGVALPVAVRGETLERVWVEDVDHVEHRRRTRGAQGEVELGAAARKLGVSTSTRSPRPRSAWARPERAPDRVGRGQAAAPAHERSAELDHPAATQPIDGNLVGGHARALEPHAGAVGRETGGD